MAGNQSDFRRAAQRAYEEAVRTGANRQDLDKLYAAYAARQAEENAACGTSHQARKKH